RVGVVYNIEDEEGNSKIEIKEFKVTGIMDEVPEKSHVHPRIVFSISTLNSTLGGNILEGSHPEDWFWRGRIAHTYILLKEGVQPETLNNQFVSFIKKYVDEATTTRGYKYNLNLERIDEIHLHADVYNNFEQPTSRSTLNSLGISALLILLIAIINFVNLSTAKSTTRSKEVGIRKVLGATKGKLVLQYLGESIMYTLIAFAGASLLVYLVQPTFFFYLGKSYSLTGINLFFYILMVAGLALFVGVVSGSFSAFILSGLSVTKTLKGEFKSGLKGNILRKGLVVAQFSITVIFIILTITVYQQISYMQDKELGFNKNQLLVINPSSNEKLLSNLKSVKNELESYSSIKDVSISSSVPGAPVGGDIWVREDQSGEEAVQISEIVVDYNYLSTFEIELIAGRNFNKEFGQDRYDVYNPEMTVETSIIINEASVKQFGFEDPQDAIGKVVVRDPASKDFYGRIIGVVKDFNYDKLQYKISPLVMFISDWYASNIRCVTIKYNGGDTRPILNFAKSVYSKYNIDEELSYFFVDENFNSLYEEQERSGEIYAYVSGLTVLIACMGLFGLSVFSTQRRTKEIAIRKIVGSSVFDLIKLLSAEFVLLLFIANLLALPVAYYFIQDWLEEFAYRIDIGVDIFLLVAISTIFISLLTVGYQVIKVASANPIDSIKYE
ncbi:MAG: FtsX-like permease family protein, partial [Melioribacteraceae bacterium]|nr:FtsX-like permease family protein [Melioribacteraceae bacterium]